MDWGPVALQECLALQVTEASYWQIWMVIPPEAAHFLWYSILVLMRNEQRVWKYKVPLESMMRQCCDL
jgi:hypothetical protein